jgi:hypothetical protein
MSRTLTTKRLPAEKLFEDSLKEEYRAFKKMLPRLLQHYKGE